MQANSGRPSGLWLRSQPGESTGSQTGLHTRAVPEHPSVTRLLVGAPGEPAPDLDEIVAFVGALDAPDRATLRVVVYGPEPDERVSLAQRLADALGEPVQARHGLVLADGRESATTAVDADGLPTWQPFATVSTYRPGGIGAEVVKGRAPAAGLSPAGPHRYRLADDWVVDVVPAGLVVRSEFAEPDPWPAVPPVHSDRMDLFLDVRNHPRPPDGMLSALGRFADTLPGPARSRMRLVLPEDASERLAQSLRWAVPAPQHLDFPTAPEAAPEAVVEQAPVVLVPPRRPLAGITIAAPATRVVVGAGGRMLLR